VTGIREGDKDRCCLGLLAAALRCRRLRTVQRYRFAITDCSIVTRVHIRVYVYIRLVFSFAECAHSREAIVYRIVDRRRRRVRVNLNLNCLRTFPNIRKCYFF